jgi:hypothetical protein
MLIDIVVKTLGGYSQNFFTQILKIFVTLGWILEPITNKN